MDVRRYQDPDEFRAVVSDLLGTDPVRHTVALTVMNRFLTGEPRPAPLEPLMVSLHRGGELVGAALRTPPWPFIVSAVPLDAMQPLAEALTELDPGLPGVTGPRDRAEPFADVWAATTGAGVREAMASRLYELGDLTPPTTEGRSRLATEADIPLLVNWRIDFQLEATGRERQPGDSEPLLRRTLASGDGMPLWEVDGKVVAWATVSAPINAMSRIGPVYTPPAYRGHGYGSAVTAAASRWALDSGAAHVLLLTDLANPTSNSIYQKIGYRRVYDSTELEFTPLPSNL
jgi:predicted GNAT family acetyltransferase